MWGPPGFLRAPNGRPRIALGFLQTRPQLHFRAALCHPHARWCSALFCCLALSALSLGTAQGQPADEQGEASEAPADEPPTLLRRVTLSYPEEAERQRGRVLRSPRRSRAGGL